MWNCNLDGVPCVGFCGSTESWRCGYIKQDKRIKMTNGEHVVKLSIEVDELKIKAEKLDIFIDTDRFKALNKYHRELLKVQAYHMDNYLKILRLRIKDISNGQS